MDRTVAEIAREWFSVSQWIPIFLSDFGDAIASKNLHRLVIWNTWFHCSPNVCGDHEHHRKTQMDAIFHGNDALDDEGMNQVTNSQEIDPQDQMV